MSILNYFSKDPDKRAGFIFDFIAPVYGLVDGVLESGYKSSIHLLNAEIDLNNMSVLDIGTGTGAWAAMFLKQSNSVQGIDFSQKMLAVSEKKHPGINFSIGNAEDLSEIADNSFDLVTASYVIHGVTADKRAKILSEMKRVSKKHVVIHDFVGRTPLFTRFLEFMERSDYKDFKKNFCKELQIMFPETKKIRSVQGSGLYLATK
ncbi:MAG: class I SAM-dependent methyltransferase [Candidatus Kapabacteria bacterium]|jgi:ubiquinone/menaquinone biosynthesis C-methylase UbiE|nr:class I SAM-dependent methyltransferase [Candidatus Kapabacteria bacterium]